MASGEGKTGGRKNGNEHGDQAFFFGLILERKRTKIMKEENGSLEEQRNNPAKSDLSFATKLELERRRGSTCESILHNRVY